MWIIRGGELAGRSEYGVTFAVCVVIVDLKVRMLGRWGGGVEGTWRFTRLSWCVNGVTGCAQDTAKGVFYRGA